MMRLEFRENFFFFYSQRLFDFIVHCLFHLFLPALFSWVRYLLFSWKWFVGNYQILSCGQAVAFFLFPFFFHCGHKVFISVNVLSDIIRDFIHYVILLEEIKNYSDESHLLRLDHTLKLWCESQGLLITVLIIRYFYVTISSHFNLESLQSNQSVICWLCLFLQLLWGPCRSLLKHLFIQIESLSEVLLWEFKTCIYPRK